MVDLKGWRNVFVAREDLEGNGREVPLTVSNLIAQCFLLTKFSIRQLRGGFWYPLAVHFTVGRSFMIVCCSAGPST